ncbi:MAG: polyprenyl synthetase family protein [Dehalococcoidales bacterium]|nr:polyprenyl synthetase family protein [Dehalococcoidales bacterium]
MVKESLTQTGRGFAIKSKTQNYKPWPLLVLVACEAISGKYEHALPAAAALQLHMAAGDIFDDIEDADSKDSIPARYGITIATNIATTILTLAEKAITQLKKKGIDDHVIVSIIDIVNSLCITSCVGQHLDLSLASNITLSEDMYFRIIGMKSASQIECACHVGALLTTTDQDLVDTFAKFGHNLGMASQIANDIQGITTGIDLFKKRMTLPVIYALNQANKEDRYQLKFIFSRQSGPITDLEKLRNMITNNGAIYYSIIKMELFKQQALDILTKIKEKGINIERMKLFLE